MTSFIARFSKLARLISGFVCLGLTIQLVADGQPERDGQWLQYRRDPALTGRSPLKGNMTAPAIKWKYGLNAREGFFTLRLDGSVAGTLEAPKQELNPGHCDSIVDAWGMGTAWYQLENGQNVVLPGPQHINIGHFLPGVSGLQLLEFDTGFDAGGDSSIPRYGRLLVRQAGQWQERWKTGPIPTVYVANPIVADFDADGRLEVAFTPWYDLWMLDLETGNLEQKCKYQHPDAESGRAYGYLGAHDLFGDKRLEIVMLSNSELHMDVFGWDENGQLKIVWSRLIQRGVGHKEKRLQVMRDPVRDIDGDGKPEIVVAIYNRDGKGRWRTEVVDPETGKARYDLDNQCVIDLIDLDGDGACELFCLQSDQMEPLEWNRISIVQCRGGKARILWTKDLAAFETARRLGFPPHYRTNANWVLPQLLTGVLDQGRRPLFITRRLLDPETRHMELTLWRMVSDGKIESLASVSGPELKGRAIASSDSAQAGAVLVHTLFPARDELKLDTRRSRAEFQTLRRVGCSPSIALVGRSAGQTRSTVYVEDAMENIVALTPSRADPTRLQLQWRRPGRGYFNHDNFSTFCHGPVLLADLTGNGEIAMVCATRNSRGNARIIARSRSGEELWHHDLDVPGALPLYPRSGVMMWFGGHFTASRRTDVLVVYKDASYFYRLLNGETGELIYEGERNGVGYSMAVFDYDGDGLDDFLAGFDHTAIKGQTGGVLMHRRTGWGELFRAGTFRAEPIVADFIGDGSQQILYATSQNVVALLRMDGSIIWQKCSVGSKPVSPQGVLPSVGDFDGDGRLEMCGVAWHDGQPDSVVDGNNVRCFDTATGALEWKLKVPQHGHAVTSVSCDIDGDGRDECLLSSDNTLYAIGVTGKGRQGAIKWKLDLPGRIGPATVARLHEGGEVQIIVVCADGYVYGIGNAD